MLVIRLNWNRYRIPSLAVSISLVLLLVLSFNIGFAESAEQVSPDKNTIDSINIGNALSTESSNISTTIGQEGYQPSQNMSYDTINLSANPGHSQRPEIITSGAYQYTLWQDDTYGNRDIFFKRSIDNGLSFGETINLSDNPGGSLNAQMAVSNNTGNVYVVWEHIPGNNGEVFFARSTDNGQTFEKPFVIGNNTGLNGLPQVIVSDNNNGVYVVWHDAHNGILFRKSIDNGVTFDRAVGIGDKNVDSQNPQLSVSQDNNIYVAWQSNPQGADGEIVFATSTDNGESFKTISLGKENGGNQDDAEETSQNNETDKKEGNIQLFQPRILTAPRGNNVYVIWHEGFNTFHKNYFLLTDIFFARSTDNGNTFEEPISLTNYSVWVKGEDNNAPFVNPISLSGYSGWVLDPQIAISQDNNIYVAWESNPQAGNGEIVFTKSTDNGETFENPVIISDSNSDSQNPQLSVSQDNNIYVAWESNSPQAGNGEIVFTKSTDNGEKFENPVIISDSKGNSMNSRLAITRDNVAHVVWDNNATGNEDVLMAKINPNNMSLFSSNSVNNKYGLQNVSKTNELIKNPMRIALVERTFTDAAYNSALYLFYNTKHYSTTNITKYTNLLSSKDIRQYSILPEFEAVVNHLKWLTPQSNITVLTDADVHDTSTLFMKNGTIKFDVIILGHNEYVTQQEYSNLRQFVANGGLLMLLDGNVLYAEVKYDKKNQTITLVKGHRWEFDGTFASNSVDERWANETTQWVGSNYCECWGVDNIRFTNNPFGVRHNEEQYITNANAKIILDYQASDVGDSKFLPKDFKIATYELDYKDGKVITLGLYTDDLLFNNDKFRQFFDSLLYYYSFGS
jgi:hypothetical protein